MKLRELLEKWSMTSLRINLKFLEAEFNPKDDDRYAAWELYVEMLTRITTQPLDNKHGNEKTALDSVFSLFPTTREILKKYRDCTEFSKIAIVVLNQVVRPFTAKWHKLSLENCFSKPKQCKIFRKELADLQIELRKYTKILADMAQVEDLTDLETT